MRGPNRVVVAISGAGAFASAAQCWQRQAKRRWRMSGFGVSISSKGKSIKELSREQLASECI